MCLSDRQRRKCSLGEDGGGEQKTGDVTEEEEVIVDLPFLDQVSSRLTTTTRPCHLFLASATVFRALVILCSSGVCQVDYPGSSGSAT